jgi:flagellar assembly factor FliW
MAIREAIATRRCETKYFGPVDYDENSVMVFADGIPAFEQEKRFVALRQPISEPLVFLQSVGTPEVCFATLPMAAACPAFRLNMAPEDLEALGLERERQPAIGNEVLCLAILSLTENEPPTVNLLAPIVVNVHTLRARQAIQTDSSYSHREPLPLREVACS